MTEHKGTKNSAGKLWKMLRAVLFCAVLALMFFGTYRLLERKDGRVRVEPFAKEESDIDVLFFGTSHVVDGIYPMELWKDYGIASYNLGFNQCTMPTAYWLLSEVCAGNEQKACLSMQQIKAKARDEYDCRSGAYE